MEHKDIGAYILYSDGTILKKSTGKRHGGLTPNTDGYMLVCINGKQLKVHRVIANAFIPNPENKPQVNHKNGIKTDNRIENLEWCTIQENIRHAFKTGLCKGMRGSTNPASDLTEDQVREIKIKLKKDNRRGCLTRIGKEYNVTLQCIWLIREGKNWGHIQI